MQSVQTPISGAGAKLALTIEILLLGASPRHFLRAYTECHLRASTGQHIQANFEYYQRVSLGHQSKAEWHRECPLLSPFIGLNFQSRSKAASKVLGKLEIRLVRWWRGCLAIIARCPSVPAKRQTTMRVDNGGIVPVHRSTLSTLWGGGEAIKGSCASRPIHLNSRERGGDGRWVFISSSLLHHQHLHRWHHVQLSIVIGILLI